MRVISSARTSRITPTICCGIWACPSGAPRTFIASTSRRSGHCANGWPMIDGQTTREETQPPEGQESRIQRFFTDRARLYDTIFLGLFRYGDGLRAFFWRTHYLRSDMKILD